MHTTKIVIIGGPSTGKSSLINQLTDLGYYCFEEVSRQVTLEAQKEEGITQLFLDKPLLFSEKLLQGRIQQYLDATQIDDTMAFFDRGIPDISAYMDYKGKEYPDAFRKANKKYIYDKVFILPIWDEIYHVDNERYENLEEAKKIQQHLIQTYSDLGYELIAVPKDSVENRISFIFNHLNE